MVFNIEYPYEGESICSWLIRMYSKSTFIEEDKFLKRIFNKKIEMTYDGIGYLNSLREGLGLTEKEIECIVNKNSLIPLLKPFQDSSKMVTSDSLVYNDIWVKQIETSDSPCYKICPQCYVEDIATKGEGYLQLYQQVQGVVVCTKHKVDLQKVKCDKVELKPTFLKDEIVSYQYIENKRYYEIACAAEKILKNNTLKQINSKECIKKYRKRIKEIYDITLEHITMKEVLFIQEKIKNYYGKEFQNYFNETDKKTLYEWLWIVVLDSTEEYRRIMPIHHLLIILFLFGDVETFKSY